MTLKYSKLRGKHILFLGGTAGIGLATAEASLEAGAIAIISGSNPDRLSSALSQLKTAYPDAASEQRIHGHVCDLSSADTLEANVKALLDFATQNKSHKLDHIVFTAGDIPPVPQLSEYQPSTTRAPAEIIRHSGGLVIGKLAPEYMSPGPNASITFSGGITSLKPSKGRATMAGLASHLDGMTRGLAVELAPIRVNQVALGAVETELLVTLIGGRQNWDQLKESYSKTSLLGKIGAPEDVAEAYMYFMKDSFVTGQVLFTDGGYILA